MNKNELSLNLRLSADYMVNDKKRQLMNECADEMERLAADLIRCRELLDVLCRANNFGDEITAEMWDNARNYLTETE